MHIYNKYQNVPCYKCWFSLLHFWRVLYLKNLVLKLFQLSFLNVNNIYFWDIFVYQDFYFQRRPKKFARKTDQRKCSFHYDNNPPSHFNLQYSTSSKRKLYKRHQQKIAHWWRVRYSNFNDFLSEDRICSVRSWNVNVLLDDGSVSGSVLDLVQNVSFQSSSANQSTQILVLCTLWLRNADSSDCFHLHPRQLWNKPFWRIFQARKENNNYIFILLKKLC